MESITENIDSCFSGMLDCKNYSLFFSSVIMDCGFVTLGSLCCKDLLTRI